MKVRQADASVRRQPARQAVEEILFEGFCEYCRLGGRVVVDHRVPRSRGGSNERHNLAGACWPCNHEKSDRTVEEWKADRLAAGKPWPPPAIGLVIVDLAAQRDIPLDSLPDNAELFEQLYDEARRIR